MKKIVIFLSIMSLLVIFISSEAISKEIKIKSNNGIEFNADFFEAENSNSPTVLILPGMSARRGPYEKFSKKLNALGFNVLSINYSKLDRVSTSAKHREKKRVLEKRGGTLGFVENEVTASLEFLRSQESVDKDRIGILGWSLGTWTGFQSMAKFKDIKCLIMVSPICGVSGKSFKTYEGTLELANEFGNRHLFLVASEKDRHSTESPSAVEKSEYLISIMPKAIIDKKYYSGKSHGYYMLSDYPDLHETLNTWIQKTL